MKSLSVLMLVCLVGCARFSMRQTDREFYIGTNRVHETITSAGGFTLFDARAGLANWQATNRVQGASVGSISQESSGSNTVSFAEKIVEGAVRGAVQGAKP